MHNVGATRAHAGIALMISKSLLPRLIELKRRRFFVYWFRENGRTFPWRAGDVSPFQLMITEMLLRQTRAGHVEKMWSRFFERFANFEAIERATEADLFSEVRILGFGNQRAHALKHAARFVLENYAGRVPHTPDGLLAVPHLGNYSARAILCFAFGERVEIVDTNVLRLFSRYFGLPLKPDIRRAPEAWQIAQSLLPRTRMLARDHNYGILDFTADICKPGRPLCQVCPVQRSCSFGQNQF